jgi:hypothetical protein
VSRNPAVTFAHCEVHTSRLISQAFSAIDPPLRAGPGSVVPPESGHSPGPEQGAERHPVSVIDD